MIRKIKYFNKKKRFLTLSRGISLGIVVFVAAWFLISPWTTEEGIKQEADFSKNSAPTALFKVSYIQSKEEKYQQKINSPGILEAVRFIELRSETVGTVESISVTKGMQVSKGTPLIRIAMDDRKSRLNTVESQVKKTNLEYEAAQSLIAKGFISRVRLAETQANYQKAKSDLEAIKLDISRTVVRAPFAGIFQNNLVEKGAHVSLGTPLATFVDLEKLKIVANVTERDIFSIKIDNEAQAKLFDGRQLKGKVSYISSTADPNTRTFRVEILADNVLGLESGLTVDVSILGIAMPAHKIPISAFTLNDQGILGVKTLGLGDIVFFHPIQLHADLKGYAWVTGLNADERIIVLGHEYVKEGQQVEPVEEDRSLHLLKPQDLNF